MRLSAPATIPATITISDGTPVLYGPYVVDYTDIPTEAAKMALWVPAVGDVLLRLFPDWQTVVQWDQGNLFLGQGVDGTVSPPLNLLAFGQGGTGFTGGQGMGKLDTLFQIISTSAFDAAGNSVSSTAYVFHSADPVQIQLAQTGGTDPGAGHVELYALIARAVAP